MCVAYGVRFKPFHLTTCFLPLVWRTGASEQHCSSEAPLKLLYSLHLWRSVLHVPAHILTFQICSRFNGVAPSLLTSEGDWVGGGMGKPCIINGSTTCRDDARPFAFIYLRDTFMQTDLQVRFTMYNIGAPTLQNGCPPTFQQQPHDCRISIRIQNKLLFCD